MVISYLIRQLQSQGDVFRLSALIAAAEQNDQETPALHIIDPVSGAIMDTKLADAITNWLYVAGIAERETAHPTSDLRFGSSMSQAREPLGKSPRLADFDHS